MEDMKKPPIWSECLACTHPQLVPEWHDCNALKPTGVRSGAHAKILWVCSKDARHTWKAPIYSRTSGKGCPFCCGKQVLPSDSLAATHPELARQWHSSNKLSPTDVAAGSGKTVRWQCQNDFRHSWDLPVVARVRGRGCPFCSGRQVDQTNSVETTHPELLKIWHPRSPIRASEVTAGSHRVGKWRCEKNKKHVWNTEIYRIVAGERCPYCAGKRVDESNSLLKAFPDLIAEWHQNNTLVPNKVTASSNRRVKWRCVKNTQHVWIASICDRTHGHGCPFCSGLKADDANNLAILHPYLIKEWHPSNKMSPYEVPPSSGRKVLWQCLVDADHVWEARIDNRALHGTGCRFCGQDSRMRHLMNRNWPGWQEEIAHEERRLQSEGLLPLLDLIRDMK